MSTIDWTKTGVLATFLISLVTALTAIWNAVQATRKENLSKRQFEEQSRINREDRLESLERERASFLNLLASDQKRIKSKITRLQAQHERARNFSVPECYEEHQKIVQAGIDLDTRLGKIWEQLFNADISTITKTDIIKSENIRAQFVGMLDNYDYDAEMFLKFLEP